MANKFTQRLKLIPELREAPVEVPDLIEMQKKSYQIFLDQGIEDVLLEISPIKAFNEKYELEFLKGCKFDKPELSVDECIVREATYNSALKVPVRLINKETGEIKKVNDAYLGDVPMMTKSGTFIVNGVERVVVNQFVRAPGVYFEEKARERKLSATIIPLKGGWITIDYSYTGVDVKINGKKMPLGLFLYAIGWEREELKDVILDKGLLESILTKVVVEDQDEAIKTVYAKLRPGESASLDSAKQFINTLFFDESSYTLGKVGRHKINKKLGLDVDPDTVIMTKEDIIGTVNYFVKIDRGEGLVDETDHLGNKRVRSVAELLQERLRNGLTRLEKLIKEQMTLRSDEDLSPKDLINVKPLNSTMNTFFGSSQLSQFMDQVNALSEIVHKRKTTALGQGAIRNTRLAKLDVRDVHPSHYGRVCPVESPEGMNAGLVLPMSTYVKVNDYGFMETPYIKVEDGKLTDVVEHLTADTEDHFKLAPYDLRIENGKIVEERVPARYRGNIVMVEREEVDYIGVSPWQLFGVSSCLIPFLEHDDANRALMGANMQRQATPLVYPDRPYVGTGMEKVIAKNTGFIIYAEEDGEVTDVDAGKIVIKNKSGKSVTHKLTKYRRSNQSTCKNHKPIVDIGQKVRAGDPLVDGFSVKQGELALGRNTLIAFMPWEGYNFEDAILVSERLVKDDVFTSIHVSKYEVEVRNTKLGAEEITPELPNVGEEALRNLDENGIIRPGSVVKGGDILVGKVTPKGESEPPAEEKLLRAIFGEKAKDMKDSSLKMSISEEGKVIDVKVFSREEDDDLPAGVNQIIRVYVAQTRKLMIGDKMAGRHGNKGIVSTILPVEDMPFLPDGTPVDVVLNPLGVPSRMNVGQVFETILGGAAGALDQHLEVKQFDETFEEAASDKYVVKKVQEAKKVPGYEWMSEDGKQLLRDGRTGELFDRPVTTGYMYMLKLIHMVEDKMHSRSTGPYSLITQQPLGGKSQFGGQRMGEMEVWALEAYGAAYTLQELLTVKSDDVSGRAKVYESIIKGKNLPKPGTPEAFRVFIREMRSLALDMKVISKDGTELDNR